MWLRSWLSCLSVLAVLLAAVAWPREEAPVLQTGDVVLQTSRSPQSEAIQRATGSPYSHVGIVEVTEEGTFVIEAVQPVSRTPYDAWKRRGVAERVRVLRPLSLDERARQRVVAVAKRHLGKPYDWRFGWDDGTLYCSELVYKAFDTGAGLKLGRLQKLKTLDLRGLGPELKRRYGPTVPLDLELVTPAAIAADDDLFTVHGGL